MKLNRKIIAGLGAAVSAALIVAGCAGMPQVSNEKTAAVLKESFKERGQAGMDRLEQDEVQKACSVADGKMPDKAVLEALEKAQLAAIKYPADGKLLGDWRAGERIAQTGTGKQYSDNPAVPSGANCYACHQLTAQEISFGTIGPSLLGYGKLRGNSEAIQRYTYGKIYNSNAYSACSNMPRFGHQGILTEEQIKNVTALLLDPQSPVNQ
jgi:sulfur-oxidizing protein SoxX